MNRRATEMISRLTNAGIRFDDALALRRISMTLHRWYELECGDGDAYTSWAIERDEETEIPYMNVYPCNGQSRNYRYRVPDREKGALKRLAKIMVNYPDFEAYVQTDPRGCALYIVSKAIIGDRKLDECYNSGIAVFK